MAGDTSRLREHIRRRMAERGMRDLGALNTASGVPVRTINNILAGKPSRARDAVEVALGWRPGSIQAVLSGGQATPVAGDSVAEGNKDAFVSRRAPTPLEAVEAVRDAMEQANAALAELARALAAQNPEADR